MEYDKTKVMKIKKLMRSIEDYYDIRLFDSDINSINNSIDLINFMLNHMDSIEKIYPFNNDEDRIIDIKLLNEVYYILDDNKNILKYTIDFINFYDIGDLYFINMSELKELSGNKFHSNIYMINYACLSSIFNLFLSDVININTHLINLDTTNIYKIDNLYLIKFDYHYTFSTRMSPDRSMLFRLTL